MPAPSRFHFTPFRPILLLVGLALIVVSWGSVLAARANLTVRYFERDGVPITYMVSTAQTGEEQTGMTPAVLIAHGFGGSRQLMLGYAIVLARAGYAVILWDFSGHAANPRPLNAEGDALQRDLDAAYAELIAQPEVDQQQVALLGHSMGSGAVMNAGILHPDRYRATIAISPTGANVTPVQPRNLLLMAGAWETPFIENARTLLAHAGGANDDLAAGVGRQMLIVPAAEHILILFQPFAHHAALNWLDRAFGRQTATPYTDLRIIWYGLNLLGGLLLITGLSPHLPIAKQAGAGGTRRGWQWGSLLLAPFLASGLLSLLNQFVDIRSLGGLLVGSALALWFFLMGMLWWGIGFTPAKVTTRALLRGMGLFVFLWLAFGALAQLVWLPWLLIPARLLRWPVLALLCLPWLVAAGQAMAGQNWRVRLAWWLVQSVTICGGLLLTVLLVPTLGIIILLLPLMPVLIGYLTIAGAGTDAPWTFALGSALFFSWLLLAYFPLAG